VVKWELGLPTAQPTEQAAQRRMRGEAEPAQRTVGEAGRGAQATYGWSPSRDSGNWARSHQH
jgi:hypothetical protein